MPEHSRPSAVPRRRATLLAPLLLVVAALAAAVTVRAQTVIDREPNPPGGWEPARQITSNRCIPVREGAESCQTFSVAADGLFRLPSKSPDALSEGAGDVSGLLPQPQLPGRPTGWQALLAPNVRVWNSAFFSWLGNNDSGFAWRSTRGYRFASKMTSSLG